MFDRLTARLRGLLTRRRAERELDEELRFHVEMETRANVARGMTLVEARRVALRDLGGVEQTRETVRDVRGLWLDSVRQDLHYAVRRCRREPGLAAAIVLTIGLAVGLTTSVYSLARGVLLRPLPFSRPGELVQVWRTEPDWPRVSVSVPEYFEWKAECRSFTALAAAQRSGFLVSVSDRTEWADALAVTPNLFPMLGVEPVLGRTFRPEEDQHGHDRVVILDEGFWRSAFGGDPRVIGRRITLVGGGARFSSGPGTSEVIGVMPASARLRYRYPFRCDLYVPLRTFGVEFQDPGRGAAALWVFGRLRPGTTIGQATAEVATVFGRLSRSIIELVPGLSVRVNGLHDELLGHTRPTFLLLGAAVLVVLLIACANLINLILASGLQRRDELSARLTLGCSRPRLIRQLVTEHLLLASMGGAVGLILAFWAVPLGVRVAPAGLPRLAEVRIDAACVAVAIALAAIIGLLLGLVPGVLLLRHDDEGPFSTRRTSSESRSRLKGALVVGEAAMVVVLLAAAGLVAQGYWRMSHVPLGFDSGHTLTARLVLPPGYDGGRAGAFERKLLTELGARPGVVGAGMTSELPFTEIGLTTYDLEGSGHGNAVLSGMSANFLQVLRVPLVAGRMLSAADDLGAKVAVVNERLARQVFPRGNAIGQRIGLDPWFEIVGIVGDVTEVGALRNGAIREKGLNRTTLPRIYVPTPGVSDTIRYLVVRTKGDTPDMARAIRTELFAAAPEVAVAETTTLDEVVASAGTDTRFYVAVLCSFATVAFTLACIGLFGVVGYGVARRRREFGVRLALGESPAGVRRLVLGQALLLVSVGCAIGLSAALAGGRVIQVFLFEVSASDPWTLAAVSAVLLAGSAVAAYLPARRASRLDPMTVLRTE
jgi:predicted permease